jgi:flagellar hook assembly protein FlgD
LENDTVNVDILDINGRMVDSFFGNIELSGTITFTFNAHSLDDGIYFVIASINGSDEITRVIRDSTATSVTPLSNNRVITLYPNPATDQVKIQSNERVENISIYNTQGALVKRGKETKQANSIDLSDLPNGMYIAKIKTVQSVVTKKLIIK